MRRFLPTRNCLYKNQNGPGGADIVVEFGAGGMVSVAGDRDGDAKTTIGTYASESGAWFLKNSNTPGAPDLVLTRPRHWTTTWSPSTMKRSAVFV